MHKPLEITTKITENGHTFTLKEKSVEFSMTTNTDSSGNSGAFIIMELQNGVSLILEVHGMTNMAVGQIIDFEMLVVGETHGKEKVDPYYSGKYLITQLRHEFNEVPQRHHSIFMTIVKDGYKKELEKNTDAKEPKKRSKGVVNRNAA